VLPAAARLTRSQEFGTVVRRGRRAGRTRLVVHALSAPGLGESVSAVSATPTPAGGEPARVGFVVSKAVGNSVIRHRVSRRLRHLVADRLGTLPAGCALVVRALPPAATASSGELGADLDGALRRLRLSAGPAPKTSTDRGDAV
jgi:ribonuclease P protein component